MDYDDWDMIELLELVKSLLWNAADLCAYGLSDLGQEALLSSSPNNQTVRPIKCDHFLYSLRNLSSYVFHYDGKFPVRIDLFVFVCDRLEQVSRFIAECLMILVYVNVVVSLVDSEKSGGKN